MVNDFLFHKVSEKEREEIKKEAKGIMDSFSRKLDKLKLREDVFIERENCERQEGERKGCSIDREIMFENAPEKNDGFIVGEKKKW